MGAAVRLVIKDPENFHILTTDMKEQIIKGAAATVNVEAALARKKARENIKRDFTLRNTFTLRQVQFTPMPQGRYALSAIQSIVGITEKAEYMARQETGGRHKPKSGGTLAIPSNRARGGNMGSPVKARLRLAQVKRLKVRGQGSAASGTHKSRAVARAAVAFQESKIVQYGGNLHFVDSFRASGGSVSFRLRQVYSFDFPSTVTPETQWLRPAAFEVARDGEKIFISQMKKLGM
jgi:hypothetical protein